MLFVINGQDGIGGDIDYIGIERWLLHGHSRSRNQVTDRELSIGLLAHIDDVSRPSPSLRQIQLGRTPDTRSAIGNQPPLKSLWFASLFANAVQSGFS